MKRIIFLSFCVLFFKQTKAQIFINGDITIQNGVTLFADDTIQLAAGAAVNNNGILQSTKGINTNQSIINTGNTGFILTPIPSGITKSYNIGTNNNNKISILHNTGSTVNYQLGARDNIYAHPQLNEKVITSNVVNKTWIVQPLSNSNNTTIGLFWNVSDELSGFNRVASGMSKWQSGVSGNWSFVNGYSTATLTGLSPAYAKTVNLGNLNAGIYYFGLGDSNANYKIKGLSRFSTPTPVICGSSTNYNVNIIGSDTFSSPYLWQFINSNDSTLSPTNDVTTQILGNKNQSIQYKLWRRISRAGTNNPDTSNWVLVSMNTPSLINATTATICTGTSSNITLISSTPSSFVWTLGTNTGSITGASASNGSSINQTLTNPSNTNVGSIIYNVTPTSTIGSCIGITTAVTVTVNPRPTMTSSTSQPVCSGVPFLVSLTANTTGGTNSFSWTTSSVSGINGNNNSNGTTLSQTLTSSDSITKNVVYTITPTFTYNSVGCIGNAANITISVNPRPVITNPISQTICSGTMSNINLTANTSGGINTFTFSTSPVSGLSGNFSNSSLPTSISQTLSTSNTSTTSAIYSVTPTFTNNSLSCSGNAVNVTINVNPTPSVNSPSLQTVCSGVSSSVSLTANTSGGTNSFIWSTSGNSNLGGFAASGTTSTIGAHTITTSSITAQNLNYSITPTYTNNSVACTGTSQNYTYTINPKPILTSSTSQTICSGISSSILLTSNTSGGSNTFAWSTTGNSSLGGFATSGATARIGPQTITTTSNSAQNLVYTIIPSYTYNSVSCPGTSGNFTFTINPIPSVSSSSSQTVCTGVSSSVSITASTFGGSNSFVWNTLGNLNLSGFSSSGTSNSIGPHTIATSSNAPQLLVYSITPTYTNNSVSCTGSSQNYTYTINPRPTITNSTSQTVCSDVSSSISLTSNTIGGSNSFTWSTLGNSNLSGFNASGSSNTIGSQTIITNSNVPQTLTYAITPIFTNNSVACSGTSLNYTYTINPRPVLSNNLSQTICTDVSSNITLAANTIGTNSFSWSTMGNPNLSGFSTSGSTNQIGPNLIINGSTTPQILIFSITPTFTFNSVSCSGATVSYYDTINPRPTVISSSSQTICSGLSSSISLNSNTSGGLNTFNWTTSGNSKLSSYLTGATTSNIGTHSINNNDFTNQDLLYNIIPTFTNNGVSCIGKNAIFTYTINPIPNVYFDDSINFGSSKQVICSGTSFKTTKFKTDYDVSKTRFDWSKTNLTTIQGLKDTGSGNITSSILSNNQINPDSVLYSITPRFINNNITCAGNSISTKIIVNPKPQIIGALSQTICSGASTSLPLNVNTNLVNTSISWNTVGNTKLSAYLKSDTNFIIGPHKIKNNDTTNQNLVYKIIPTYKNNGLSCIGDTANYTYSVLSTPIPNASFTFSQSQGNVLFTPSQSGLTYKWYFGDGDSGNVQNPTHKYKNNGVYNVRLIVDNNNGCSNDTIVSININTVGLNNIEIANFQIYPNPTTGTVNILSNQTISNISVFDVTGKLVYSQTMTSKLKNTEIDLSALSSGLYFIHAQTLSGQSSSNKIVITK